MHAFLRTLDRVLDRLYTGCGIIGAGFLVLIAICVALSIVTRLLGIYVAGLTAYSGYAMAASSFLALAYTFRAGGHIRVALVRNSFGPRGQLVLELWCLALASLFTGFLAFYLARMAWVSWVFGEKSEGGAATPLWIPQTAVAAGATVMAIAALHALILTIVMREPDAALSNRPETQVE
jgi:TRAP-type mannitol/chloroaromatic compound transport system permease small subunit